MNSNYGSVYDYETATELRTATVEEWAASVVASFTQGGSGAIEDETGRPVYVEDGNVNAAQDDETGDYWVSFDAVSPAVVAIISEDIDGFYAYTIECRGVTEGAYRLDEAFEIAGAMVTK